MSRPKLPRVELSLGATAERVKTRLAGWAAEDVLPRFRRRDPSLWPGDADQISARLGWVGLPQDAWLGGLDAIVAAGQEARQQGIDHTILIGMGGSSLTSLVLERIFKPSRTVLRTVDSTHPDLLREVIDRLPPKGFQCIVASKTGTTLETRVLSEVLFHAAERWVAQPGSHFLAITDEGTPLAEEAERRNYRSVFTSPADVGGRFSALSVFGLLPAAMAGIDPERLLRRANLMEDNCMRGPASVGLELGAALGELALEGRDKLTLLTSPGLSAFPLWLEQLVAESLGKDGRGIVPVIGEPRGAADGYSDDRVFVGIGLEDEDPPLSLLLKELSDQGHPTIQFHLDDRYDLGAEFFRWQVAVAAAAMVLEVNPFDQPDVESTKVETRRIMERGASDLPVPGVVAASDRDSLTEALKNWLGWGEPGDYFSVLAYLPTSPENSLELAELQRRIRNLTGLPANASYGPRYLHSTGQLHKGGPNTGVFLQIVPSPQTDFLIPGEETSLGTFIKAQAEADAAVLAKKGRRLLRVDLEDSGRQGLWMLRQLLSR